MRTVVGVTVTVRAAADPRQLDIGAEAVVFLGAGRPPHLLARTPVIRVDDDLPAAVAAVASCGAFTVEHLALGIARGGAPDGLTEFALADAAVAYAALVAGARVALRPSPRPAP